MARSYPLSITPGILCSLISFVLLLMVTISAPLWNKIYFLKMVTGPDEPDPLPSNAVVLFGTFGTSNGTNQLGYDPSQWSHTGAIDPTVVRSHLIGITRALVLHPIAACVAAITAGFSLIGLCTRAGAVFATFSSGLMTLVCLVVFIVDIILFSILKSEFSDPPYQQRKVTYGPALWMTLAALIASILSLASAAFTAFSTNRYPRKWKIEEEFE